MRVGRKRFHALEADDLFARLLDREQKHATIGERLQIAAFVLDREGRVEDRVDAFLNDSVENAGNGLGVFRFGGANR